MAPSAPAIGAGESVGVDVVGLPVRALRDRRQHRDQLAAENLLEHGHVDLVGLADKAEIDDVFVRAACGRWTLRALTILPSLPHRPTARPPSALIEPTICLLIEPASTISTISMVGLSVTLRPPGELRFDAELLQHRADLRAAAMDDDRIDAGLLQQHHVLGEVARLVLVAHRVAAILHDDDRLVVAQHMRQRLHQDFGLLLRSGVQGVGHRGSEKRETRARF